MNWQSKFKDDVLPGKLCDSLLQQVEKDLKKKKYYDPQLDWEKKRFSIATTFAQLKALL